MPHPPFQAYRQRLGFHIPGILLALVLSVLSAALIGFLYALLIWYIPEQKIRAILPFGTSLGIGAAAGYLLARIGHVRPRVFCGILAFFAISTAYLVAWVTWLHAVIGWQTLILNPFSYAALISEIYEKGAYSMQTGPIQGLELGVIWSLEFLSFFVVGAVAAMGPIQDMGPYCDACRTWTQPDEYPGFFAPPADLSSFQSQLNSGSLDALSALTPVSPLNPVSIRAEIFRCRTCNNFHTLRIRRLQVQFYNGTRVQDKTTHKLAHLVIDPDTAKEMARLFITARQITAQQTTPTTAPTNTSSP